MTTAEIAAAVFFDDKLAECWSAVVAVRAPAGWSAPSGALGLEQAALMVFDNGLVYARNGASSSAQGGSWMTDLLTAALTKDGQRIQRVAPALLNEAALGEKAKAERPPKGFDAVLAELHAELRWPLASAADMVKSGQLVKVPACAFPNRTALGTCLFEGKPSTAELPSAYWSLRRMHYAANGTIDTDADMKSCLRGTGTWLAPTEDDPKLAAERLRQRIVAMGRSLDSP